MGNCEPDTPQVFNSARVLENIEIQQKEMTCCFCFCLVFLFDGDCIILLYGETGKFLPPSPHLQADLQYFLTNHSIYWEQWRNPAMHSINDLSHRY